MINLLGISGKLGSGKDLVCSIIQHLTGKNYENSGIPYVFHPSVDYSRISPWKNKKFASKLKDIVCLLIGCTREELEVRDFKEAELGEEWTVEQDDLYYGSYSYSKYSPRTLLQFIGTQLFRDRLHKNVWVNSLFSDYKKSSKFIISDLRFKNELKAIKDRGGVCIRVTRPSIPRPENEHESEKNLDDATFDFEIVNDGTIQELVEKVRVILKELSII